ERRSKILQYYFAQLNPLDAFSIANNELTFRNLGLEAQLASNASYKYQWFSFDNDTMNAAALTNSGTSDTPSLSIPATDSGYLMVRVQTTSENHPEWQKAVDVYIRNDSTKSVVGIEREN
ncbi:MAG: hypothetical protein L0287_23625, partial [Anaerolineae bacterium]|nr:hypothetical protein [Anaerolineae bacterium]